MHKALELAVQGEGNVEPNPMVGCMIVQPNQGNGTLVGQGFHEKFGNAHAEINAIRDAGEKVKGATAYVTLEPCDHAGKTPPCTGEIIKSGIKRVVVGAIDPFEKVDGRGIKRLRDAGIEVTSGVCHDSAIDLIRPFIKRVKHGMPWMIGKWAMTLDGKIATSSGDSQWISNENSRKIAHQIRGRVDAIMVGSRTAQQDDPLLTARPAGVRTATRVVLDSLAKLGLDSKLVTTTAIAPLIIAVGPEADKEWCEHLEDAGCEILQGYSLDPDRRLINLLQELARRDMTNILVEGGGKLLGSLIKIGQIDEVHSFIGPKILGGKDAISPVEGKGFDQMAGAKNFEIRNIEMVDGDVYLRARTAYTG